jgi:hypothetical protein
MTKNDNEFDPRRAAEGESFEYVDATGSTQTMKADEEGILRPSNAEEARIADLFGLPVARAVKQAEKAAASDDADGSKE